jgi:hypothetical protein
VECQEGAPVRPSMKLAIWAPKSGRSGRNHSYEKKSSSRCFLHLRAPTPSAHWQPRPSRVFNCSGDGVCGPSVVGIDSFTGVCAPAPPAEIEKTSASATIPKESKEQEGFMGLDDLLSAVTWKHSRISLGQLCPGYGKHHCTGCYRDFLCRLRLLPRRSSMSRWVPTSGSGRRRRLVNEAGRRERRGRKFTPDREEPPEGNSPAVLGETPS